jgi:hypothetical protein
VIEGLRDKVKDHEEFKCNRDSELELVAQLYADWVSVKAFLIGNCNKKAIKYFTYMDVYKLIEKELGYPLPKAK